MDALALLCNLHAEGPATLSRLHRFGHGTLEQIVALSVDELAEVLHGPPSLARRFAHEARGLLARMGPEAGAELRPFPSPPGRRAPVARPVGIREIPIQTELRAGSIEGLDEALVRALAGQGIHGVEDLLAAGLDVARRVGLPFPRLLDLQYAARRSQELPRRTAARPEPAPPAVAGPLFPRRPLAAATPAAGRPAPDPSLPGGPFA